jgi:hypothetical protein
VFLTFSIIGRWCALRQVFFIAVYLAGTLMMFNTVRRLLNAMLAIS